MVHKHNKAPIPKVGKTLSIVTVLLILLILAVVLSLCLGRYGLTLKEIGSILSHYLFGAEPAYDSASETVLLKVRMPRILAAICIGGALAAAGATYQGLFRNPMVSPDLLGATSGACFGACISLLFNASIAQVQIAAFLCGMAAVTLTYLVFNFPNPQTTEALRQAGIAVVPMASTGKLSDVKDMLSVYAEALGDDAPARAAAYAAYFDAILKKITDVTDKIPEADKKTVYFSNQNLLWTAGRQSDIVEMIRYAGGVCVSAELDAGGKTEIPKEQFIAWDPQYVFVDHAGSSGNASAEDVIAGMLDSSEYDGVQAVKNKQIFICPTGVFFWDSGVQKILMVEWMAQKLYPELFPELDMKTELKNFYSTFFYYDLTDEQADAILAHQDPAA